MGGIWWYIFTDEALCWHGSTSHEAHASGSLCSLGVSAHWFGIIGRPPLTRRTFIGALYCSVEPPDEAPIVVKTKSWCRKNSLCRTCEQRWGWVTFVKKCDFFFQRCSFSNACWLNSLQGSWPRTAFTVHRFTEKHFSLFPHSRLLWVLHQMFRGGAVRIAGGNNPLLLWRRPVLRLRPCGSDRHGHHSGIPLLQGLQWPRHADWRVSVVF